MICAYTQHSSGLRQCKTLYLIVIFPFSHFNLHAVFALSFSIHITESQFLSFDNDDMKPLKCQGDFCFKMSF